MTWKTWTLGVLAAFMATAALAKETGAPVSAFRKFFWGARQAYENRNFKEAEKLLRNYKKLGSPSDRMLSLAGCDTKWEVGLFSEALKNARLCQNARPKSSFWMDAEHAKFAILVALREGDAVSLLPYVDCAPADLVSQATTCGTHVYRKPEDLKRLTAALQKTPAVMDWPDWRHLPVARNDPQNITWMLYSASDQWKPCSMSGTPIISLRQDPATGQVRIAGFAVGCLDSQP